VDVVVWCDSLLEMPEDDQDTGGGKTLSFGK
jgi:hypothetical protein